jgi:hypothetical protein
MIAGGVKPGGRLGLAQLGIQVIAQGISQEVDPQHGKHDGEARKDGNPGGGGRELLGASLQHQSPSRNGLLHAETQIRQ